MKKYFALDAFLIVLFAISGYYLFSNYDNLPQRIAIHFNAQGVPDNYGDKSVLWIIFLVFLVISVGLRSVVDREEWFNMPFTLTDKNRAVQYSLARKMLIGAIILSSIIGAYLIWMMVQVGLGRIDQLHSWFVPVLLLCVFGGMGWYGVLAYRNR